MHSANPSHSRHENADAVFAARGKPGADLDVGEVLVRLLVNPARCFHKVDRNNAARVLCQLRREPSDSRPEFQDVLATPRVAGELTSSM
jgi:hypothetical protein